MRNSNFTEVISSVGTDLIMSHSREITCDLPLVYLCVQAMFMTSNFARVPGDLSHDILILT